MIRKVGVFHIGDVFLLDGIEYLIQSFPTRYSVVGINACSPTPQNERASCETAISKIIKVVDSTVDYGMVS